MPPPFKKRKRDVIVHNHSNSNGLDTSKPTAVFKPTTPRNYTLSVAIPGSIIANAQSHDQKTSLAGQIGRALAVFCVDEVVIFNDGQSPLHTNGSAAKSSRRRSDNRDNNEDGYTGFSDPDQFLSHLISYLETPPHLRRLLFPMHPNLRTAGTLPSLDMPHHFRSHEWCQYREGVVVGEAGAAIGVLEKSDSVVNSRKRRHKLEEIVQKEKSRPLGMLVEAGLRQKVRIEGEMELNTRVTLKFPSEAPPDAADEIVAEIVTPDTPREQAGYYWGYAVRRAPSISTVFTECPFDRGYDVTFGTSERGKPISTIREDEGIPRFKHMLIVFGGVAGLEVAVKADNELVQMGVEEPSKLFDYWVNLCPGQGSRTIRTEEALWIGLVGLRDVVTRNQHR